MESGGWVQGEDDVLMTKDISHWSKEARDARSTEMNPNNPQYYDSRHMDQDGEGASGILAVPNFCANHFDSEGCTQQDPGYAARFGRWENVAYLWNGQQWTKIENPRDYDNYDYIMLCQKCGELTSRSFSWNDYPLNLSDSAYREVLMELASTVGIKLWGDQLMSEATQ